MGNTDRIAGQNLPNINGQEYYINSVDCPTIWLKICPVLCANIYYPLLGKLLYGKIFLLIFDQPFIAQLILPNMKDQMKDQITPQLRHHARGENRKENNKRVQIRCCGIYWPRLSRQ